MNDRDWRDRALCLGKEMQPEVASETEVRELTEVCGGCPVARECRELAKAQPGGTYGVHAGSWWGEEPRRPGAVHCGWCGGPVDGQRSTSRYCSSGCRVSAHRARQTVPA